MNRHGLFYYNDNWNNDAHAENFYVDDIGIDGGEKEKEKKEFDKNGNVLEGKMENDHFTLPKGIYSPLIEPSSKTAINTESSPDNHKLIPIHQVIVDSVPLIISSLESDPYAFSPVLLRKWIELVLRNDYLKGLWFGKLVVELFENLEIQSSQRSEKSAHKFHHIANIVHLLLYPTVFDEDPCPHLKNEDESLIKKVNLPISPIRKTSELDEEDDEAKKALEITRKQALENLLKNSKTMTTMIKLE